MTARCASSIQAVLIRTVGGINPYRRNLTWVFPDPGGPLARHVVKSVITYPLFRAFSTCTFRAVKKEASEEDNCAEIVFVKLFRSYNMYTKC